MCAPCAYASVSKARSEEKPINTGVKDICGIS